MGVVRWGELCFHGDIDNRRSEQEDNEMGGGGLGKRGYGVELAEEGDRGPRREWRVETEGVTWRREVRIEGGEGPRRVLEDEGIQPSRGGKERFTNNVLE